MKLRRKDLEFINSEIYLEYNFKLNDNLKNFLLYAVENKITNQSQLLYRLNGCLIKDICDYDKICLIYSIFEIMLLDDDILNKKDRNNISNMIDYVLNIDEYNVLEYNSTYAEVYLNEKPNREINNNTKPNIPNSL